MKAVNLLPSKSSAAARLATTVKAPTRGAGNLGPLVLIGFLFASVVAVGLYVQASNSLKSNESELARAKTERAALDRQTEKLTPYQVMAKLVTERRTTVTRIAASRFDWDRSLADLARAIPEGVTLTKLTGTVSSQGAGGSSQLRSAIAAPAIEVEGCTTDQHRVARLMSRLRNIDGVTRVSLVKSDKDTQTTVTSSSGQGALCQGSPPAFDILMFFENAPAPVSSAPAAGSQAGTSAGSAGAQGGGTATGTDR